MAIKKRAASKDALLMGNVKVASVGEYSCSVLEQQSEVKCMRGEPQPG